MRLLPLHKDKKGGEPDDQNDNQVNRNNTLLPMNQMAMSMQAAAAGPMPRSGAPLRGVRKSSKDGSFMNDQGGLFY